MSELNGIQAKPVLEFGEDNKAYTVESAVKGEADFSARKTLEEHIKENIELTEEEKKQIDEFAAQIDITNSSAIINYGAGTQKKLADFSQKTLDSVRTKDMGEVGEMVTGLVVELKNFEIEDDKSQGFFGKIFSKSANKVNSLKSKYSKIETNVNTITNELEKHQITLLKDVDVLDKMYDMNLVYFKELTM